MIVKVDLANKVGDPETKIVFNIKAPNATLMIIKVDLGNKIRVPPLKIVFNIRVPNATLMTLRVQLHNIRVPDAKILGHLHLP